MARYIGECIAERFGLGLRGETKKQLLTEMTAVLSDEALGLCNEELLVLAASLEEYK